MGTWGTGPLDSDEAADFYERVRIRDESAWVEVFASGGAAQVRACVEALLDRATADAGFIVSERLAAAALSALERARLPQEVVTWEAPHRAAYLESVDDQARRVRALGAAALVTRPKSRARPVKSIPSRWQGPPWLVVPVADLVVAREFYSRVVGATIHQPTATSFVFNVDGQLNQARLEPRFTPARLARSLPEPQRGALIDRLERARTSYEGSATSEFVTFVDPSGHQWIFDFHAP